MRLKFHATPRSSLSERHPDVRNGWRCFSRRAGPLKPLKGTTRSTSPPHPHICHCPSSTSCSPVCPTQYCTCQGTRGHRTHHISRQAFQHGLFLPSCTCTPPYSSGMASYGIVRCSDTRIFSKGRWTSTCSRDWCIRRFQRGAFGDRVGPVHHVQKRGGVLGRVAAISSAARSFAGSSQE